MFIGYYNQSVAFCEYIYGHNKLLLTIYNHNYWPFIHLITDQIINHLIKNPKISIIVKGKNIAYLQPSAPSMHRTKHHTHQNNRKSFFSDLNIEYYIITSTIQNGNDHFLNCERWKKPHISNDQRHLRTERNTTTTKTTNNLSFSTPISNIITSTIHKGND